MCVTSLGWSAHFILCTLEFIPNSAPVHYSHRLPFIFSPLLSDLHWLPIMQWFAGKILICAFISLPIPTLRQWDIMGSPLPEVICCCPALFWPSLSFSLWRRVPTLKHHLSLFSRDAARPTVLLQHFVSIFGTDQGTQEQEQAIQLLGTSNWISFNHLF